jgi:hypothetical protein
MDTVKAFAAFAVVTASLLLMHACCPEMAHSRPAKRAKATAVHCTDNCQPCVALIAELKRQGVKLEFETATGSTQPVPWFPAVEYSDGVVDWGQRVFGEAVDYEVPLPVVKHKQEE